MNKVKNDIRSQFIRKYKSLTKKKRDQMILFFNGEPYTWNPIYVEVKAKSKLGMEMLHQLRREKKL